MLLKIFKNRNILTLVLSVLIFWILYFSSSYLYLINKNIQNNYYSFKRVFQQKVNPNIIIVTIDEKTLKWLWRFPFNREVYAKFLNNLKKYDIATIGFDIIFLDKTNKKADNILIKAVNNTDNIVFWSIILEDWSIEESFNSYKNVWTFLSWFLSPVVDIDNRIVYSFLPLLNVNWINYEHFAIKILRSFYAHIYENNFIDYNKIGFYDTNYYNFDLNKKIPLSSSNKKDILINFTSSNNFEKISFIDIYNERSLDQISKRIDFSDKILIVWATASWINDIFYTPNGVEYWVYIHANIINTILTKNYIIYFNKNLEWVLIFFLILLSVYCTFSKSTFVVIIWNFLIFLLFLVIIPFYIILFTNIIINFPSEIILALLLSLIISNIVKYIIEDKNKERLNTALSEYVWKDIAFEVLSWEWRVNLSWEKKNTIILFSDIKSFTTISEDFSPEDLVSFLREYLKEMSEIIVKNKGFIDKYEWDSIMALWGVFEKVTEEDFFSACNSIIEQQNRLKLLNKKWNAKFGINLYIRIWMHFWEVVVWNIWSKWTKLNFTALWNNVNIASRLDNVNKHFWTNMIVSENIYKKTKQSFIYRYLWKVILKWKYKYINIYELMWKKWAISKNTINLIGNFSKWLRLFLKGEIKEALEIFKILADNWDKPSIFYKNECINLLKKELPNDFEWVVNMKKK